MDKKKSYKISWTKKSLKSLDEIFNWNVENSSVRRATKILNSIKSKANKLRDNPQIHHRYFGLSGDDSDIRAALVHETFWLFYKIDNHEITILDLIHTSMNPDDINLIRLN